MIIFFMATAIAAALVCGPSGASAHSFQAGLLFPYSGPSAKAGRQVLDGFMLATKERDAHPDTESDGHLGGLDVYLSRIDSAGTSAATTLKSMALLRQKKIEFLAAFASPEALSALYPDAAAAKVFLIGLGDAPRKIEGVCSPYFISISLRKGTEGSPADPYKPGRYASPPGPSRSGPPPGSGLPRGYRRGQGGRR